MLVIGRAIIGHPTILLLDEPSLGLSPRLVSEVFDLVRSLAADGMTVLLVEQNVVQGLRIADRGYVLSTGRVAAHRHRRRARGRPRAPGQLPRWRRAAAGA